MNSEKITTLEKIDQIYRKITPLERIFSHSPYSIVTMIARIKGEVSESSLKDAIKKAQQRHANLRVRIHIDDSGTPWFSSDGIKEIPITIISRESPEHWKSIYYQSCKIPFQFEERPAIRFILVNSKSVSELLMVCHHIICDGMSLAYLTRDIMTYLGNPTQEVEVLPNPVPFDEDNFPQKVSMNRIVKYFINRINKKWASNPIFFNQIDYESLNEAYWKTFTHQMISVELSETDTFTLVAKCKKEGVTINTALMSAFIAAQSIIKGNKVNSNVMVAGSIRDRLQTPSGEAMGYFASGITHDFKYNEKKSFWENARKLNQTLKNRYTNKDLFKEPLTWCYLDPAILESLGFKMIGRYVSSDSPRYDKLTTFSKQDDVVSSILKRQKMDSLDKPFLGMAITNLTRLDFPRTYGSLELDRLIFNPGGGFPLALVDLVLGVVTCSGKLNLLVEFAEETTDSVTMEKIKEKALEFLLNDLEAFFGENVT
ncbi:MAG: condensation domain-containing protein [Promethearchaeota archaeon]